ncbi:MAG: hypothetical protein E3J21_24030 [Anaerolineales bacterium]|nr:MAG: hypothetical protein E3J21_24030 [Anaerolineales bacterium]
MSDFGKTKSKVEHRRIIEMLSVYIGGELPSRDRARVEEHLAECADCTWELETLRQTVDLVGQLTKVPVPRAFTIHETPRPRRVSLFQARWAYTYLKGATALAAALLVLVLAGDVLFQFQRVTTRFAPAMAPAKELAAPAAAPTVVAMQEAPKVAIPGPAATPTVVAMQEVPPSLTEAPIPPEEVLDEAEGAAYVEVTPSPAPVEETKALAPMPTPTAPADRGGGGEPTARDEATAPPLATPAPLVGRAVTTGTPPPAAAMEAPVEEAPQAPVTLAAAPMATPQPQMTAPSTPPAPSPASAVPMATPTSLATPTAAATVTPAPKATPLSMAKAPAEVRPTERRDAFAESPARPQRPQLTPLRVVEASLCLLVMLLIAATLIVRRCGET